MNITYELEATGFCPVDDLGDRYEITVRSTTPIPVERILVEVEKLRTTKIYQEEYTLRLARALQARVVSVGWHSGVKTICEAA